MLGLLLLQQAEFGFEQRERAQVGRHIQRHHAQDRQERDHDKAPRARLFFEIGFHGAESDFETAVKVKSG